MTPALEILEKARAAGLRLAPKGEKLHVEPAPPPELRAALTTAKAAILTALRAERTAEVTLAISGAYDRLNTLGPWAPQTASAYRELGAAVDAAGSAYIHGRGDQESFASALRRWEAALSAGRAPAEPNQLAMF